jgi:uncharacterized protein (TIGR03083 family)
MTTTSIMTAGSIPPITHREATRLANTEFARVIELLASLAPDEWTRPTDNAGWDVHATASHMLGMAEAEASPREFSRQARRAKRGAGDRPWIDALTAVQVEEHAALSTADLVSRFRAVAPRAVRARRRIPAPLRALPMPHDPGPPFEGERWRVGYLMDVISTRDPWMHRVDISRATGRSPVLTDGHDGRLVADVVHEWAGRHGQPFRLELRGPAGGAYEAGSGGPELECDAVEFCRVLSGRAAPTEPLLSTPCPF